MQLAARPTITAGVALAAAGMIAATPLAPSLADVQMPNINLSAFDAADITADLQAAQLGFFGNFMDAQSWFNVNVVQGTELGFENLIAPLFANLADYVSPDSILNGMLNRSYNVFNMGLDMMHQTMANVIGINAPAPDGVSQITWDLLIGAGAQNVFNSGQIGGLTGMFDQSLIAYGDFTGIINDNLGIGLPGLPMSFLQGLQAQQLDFFDNLIGHQLAFNGWLTDSEVALEQAIFGTDSALNGVVNRGFNVFNLGIDTMQQTLNGLLGAHADVGADGISELTSSLLLGSAAQVFNAGDIGGLTGMLDQSLMMFLDFLGLIGL